MKRSINGKGLLLISMLLLISISGSLAEGWSENADFRAKVDAYKFEYPVIHKLDISNFSYLFENAGQPLLLEGVRVIYVHDYDGDGKFDTALIWNAPSNYTLKDESEYFLIQGSKILFNHTYSVLEEKGPCARYENRSLFCGEYGEYVSQNTNVIYFNDTRSKDSIIILQSLNILKDLPVVYNRTCFRSLDIEKTKRIYALEILNVTEVENKVSKTTNTMSYYAGSVNLSTLSENIAYVINATNRDDAYLFVGEKFLYLFINTPQDSLMVQPGERTLIAFCAETPTKRNHMENMMIYIFQKDGDIEKLEDLEPFVKILGMIEYEQTNPPVTITNIEQRMVDYIDLNIADFKPTIDSLEEGKPESDVILRIILKQEYAKTIRQKDQIIQPIDYERGDNGREESADYSYKNGDVKITVEKYQFDMTIEYWPFDSYWGNITFENVGLQEPFSDRRRDTGSGYITTYHSENNTVYFTVEPNLQTILIRVFVPAVPLLLLLIFLYSKRNTPIKPSSARHLFGLISAIVVSAIGLAFQVQLVQIGKPFYVGGGILGIYIILGLLIIRCWDSVKQKFKDLDGFFR